MATGFFADAFAAGFAGFFADAFGAAFGAGFAVGRAAAFANAFGAGFAAFFGAGRFFAAGGFAVSGAFRLVFGFAIPQLNTRLSRHVIVIAVLRSTLVATLLALTSLAHADKGTIKGTVIYEGEVADPAPVKRDADPYCAKIKKTSDDLLVTHGKLKDAVVRVIDGPKGTAPTAPLVLDQKDCTYLPHVSAIIAGQKIKVRNSDGTFHNVRGTIGGKSIWNKPHAANAADLDLAPETHGGDVVEVQCDVHPWMHAFIAVEDGPMFAVTGDDGKFEITGLEIGSYTIESWHPKLGKRTMKVEIGRGARGTVNALLSYKSSYSH